MFNAEILISAALKLTRVDWFVHSKQKTIIHVSVTLLLTFLFPHLDFEQCAGKYTVMADYEKDGAQDLSVKSGDMVQLVKEGDDGQW